MSNIILYSTEKCPKCKVLKTKLDRKNIKYDVVTDIKDMIKLNILQIMAYYLKLKELNKEQNTILKC